jgi:olefin beta-lactone synthetase
MGTQNLGVCLDEAEPEAFIGVPKAHIGRRLYGWGKRTIRTTVNVGRFRFFCDARINQLLGTAVLADGYNPPRVTADTPAAILFTSGSTGVAKGAEYTHGIFAAQVDMLRTAYGIRPGEVDLCTFPLFALFGPALGMTCVIPDMDARRPADIDPVRTADALTRYQVTNFFGSPAVLRRLSHTDTPLTPTLRRVISAGAPAAVDVLERFTRRLPAGVQVFTPYGATEALPVANVGSDEILAETRTLTEQGHGVCVGTPFDGMTVRIIRITDEPLPAWDESLCVPNGEVGEIVVSGPVVTQRYFHRDAATGLAKIPDPATGRMMHRMGDVGYFDDRGRLWFCGRKSHRVETPHGTLFTDMVEPIFNALRDGTLPIVGRTALVGVTRNGGRHPVLCYEPGSYAKMGRDPTPILRDTAVSHEHTAEINTFLMYDRLRFPVDVRHNSKIFREQLAVWADAKLGPNWKGPTS